MTAVAKLFHPFLALIATATDRELAKYLDYLKEENKILRARLPGKQVHTTVRHNALPKASPNLNGRVERAILTLRSECLDKFIFFGKRHLDYIVSSFADYYNLRRAHSSRDSLPPIRELPEEVASLKMEQIAIKSYVGGLVTSFERKAA